MINREEFLNLYEKHLAGSCSAEEMELLSSYRDDLNLSDDNWQQSQTSRDQAYQRIWQKLRQNRDPDPPFRNHNYRSWLTAATAVLFSAASLSRM